MILNCCITLKAPLPAQALINGRIVSHTLENLDLESLGDLGSMLKSYGTRVVLLRQDDIGTDSERAARARMEIMEALSLDSFHYLREDSILDCWEIHDI